MCYSFLTVEALFSEELGEFVVEEDVSTDRSRGNIRPTHPNFLPQPGTIVFQDHPQALPMLNNNMVFQGMMDMLGEEKRKPKVVCNRKEAWNFVLSWDDSLKTVPKAVPNFEGRCFRFVREVQECIPRKFKLWVYELSNSPSSRSPIHS